MQDIHTNRRALLLGLAAASTAAATGGAAATVGHIPAVDGAATENPELLRMAEELPGLCSEYRSAREAYEAIVTDTKPIWPMAPDEIFWLGWEGDLERDVTGAALVRPGEEEAHRIGKPSAFVWEQECCREAMQKKSMMRSKRERAYRREKLAAAEKAEKMAEDYWAACERVRQASGIEPARERKAAAREALREHVSAILAGREQSMAGVVIKAQALAAWGEVELFHRMLNPHGDEWASHISASIMRQAEAA